MSEASNMYTECEDIELLGRQGASGRVAHKVQHRDRWTTRSALAELRSAQGWRHEIHVVGSELPARKDDKRSEDATIAIAPAVAGFLASWTPINERLITARFQHQGGHLTAVVIYAPT